MLSNRLLEIIFIVFCVGYLMRTHADSRVINRSRKISGANNKNVETTTKINLQPYNYRNNTEEILNQQLNITSNRSCTCVPFYLCKNGSIITDGSGDALIDIRQTGVCSPLEECCFLDNIITSTTTIVPIKKPPFTHRPISNKCGYRNVNGLGERATSVKNNESQFAEFPWMVAVLARVEELDFDFYHCGGAIIHSQAIITAAHWFRNRNASMYKIRAGEWDPKSKLEPIAHQERQVSQIRIHPEFNDGELFYDIAFLYLEEPLNFTGNVQSICLEKSGKIPRKIPNETDCFVTGWGKDIFTSNGTFQTILKKIKLPIVEREDCVQKLRRTRLGENYDLHSSFICAGGEEGTDACYGDGGGPLVCLINGSNERYYQAGIVAWGIGCGMKDVPSAYVNVPLVRHWIDERMKEFGLSSESYNV